MAAGIRAQTQPPWSSSYKIAFDHIRGGESELGVRELEALGASFPRDAVLATSIGAALDSDSRHQQAAQWYEKALAIDPQYEPALNKLGRYAEAGKVLNGASACSEVTSCLLLGSSQALSSDLPAAVSTFQSAVRLAPNVPDTYFRLALAFLQGSRDDEARETLAVGLEAVPNSGLLLYGQAIFYEHLGSYEQAIAAAMKSLEQDPARADVWALLGSLHAHQGQGEKTEKSFQKALQLGAGVGTAVEYAEFLVHEGRYAEAEKTLNELRSSHGNDSAINRGLGKLYKAQGKFDEI